MYFKLCQNCDRFFYSSAAFSAHKCNDPDCDVGAPVKAREATGNTKETEKTEIAPVPIPPAENAPSAVDEKKLRNRLLIAVKKRLADKGIDCQTLKMEQAKARYIEEFGKRDFDALEKAIKGA